MKKSTLFVVGAAVYGLAELSFQLGKGSMLGVLCAAEEINCKPSALMYQASISNNWRSKLVADTAKICKENAKRNLQK